MVRSRRIVAFILGMAIAANAGTTHVGASMSAPNLQDRPIETRVYVRKQCLLSEPDRFPPARNNQPQFLGALASIFVPLLVDKGLGAISGALRSAGAPETLRASAKLPTYLYQLTRNGQQRNLELNSDLGCVIVVRGTFSSVDPPDQSTVRPFAHRGVLSGDSEIDEDWRLQRLVQNQIPVTSIAALYEAAIIKSNDKAALHYEGRFLEVNSFQGRRSAKTRGMVISLAIYSPTARENETLLSLALQNIGDVDVRTVAGPNQLGTTRSSWLGGLGMTEAAVTALAKIKVDNGQTIGVMPVTLEAQFVEVEKGNKTLVFIADVLDAKKEPLGKAISDQILEGDKRDKAAADALEGLSVEEETAFGSYLQKKADLAAVTPLPANPTASQTEIHNTAVAAKTFEVTRTRRLWCNKYKALKAIGSAPARGEDCN
jgi:hypothetical protein